MALNQEVSLLQEIVTDGGGRYVGVQHLGEEVLVLFNSPTTHSTIALPVLGLNVEKVRESIRESDAKFK